MAEASQKPENQTPKSPFVHLHAHSHYSLLSALPKIDDLIKKAVSSNMHAIALTDNGNLYGAIEFYQKAKKKGIKPIIGLDAFVAVRGRKDMQAGVDSKRHRLVLLAKDFTGYKNLIKLVTKSNLEGFYYKPRIDKELIEKYSEGLIAIAPSTTSEISASIKMRDKNKAKEKIDWYKKIYGQENFYLEITHHPELENHDSIVSQVVELARETNTPIVAGQEIYYLNPEDKLARATLTLVNTHGDISDRITEDDESDFSFLSVEKALEYFKDYPDAIENTVKIADDCNLDLTLGKWYFPNFIVESGLSHDDELKRLAYEGIKKRGLEQTKEVIERLEYELQVIKNKGYAQYFLVVSDLLRFAHENNILTNIRGSVAGSLTTFVTGITNVNPLEYKLPFERFLNPERPSAPDIDMDFADNRRDEVIEYARKKYGYDKVAQIGTFGTMMARGAVRDVARAMGFPYEKGDKISKLIPMGSQGFPMSIDRALEETAELKEMYEKDADTKKIIEMAKKIEGCARHISVHAAGVVIAPESLDEFVPLQYDTKGENKVITQYDMHGVGEDGVGLLKFDFLGIKNLSILADAVERVKKIEDIDIDIENIPLDDKKTFEMLARGETIGLFQLNGTGMTRFLIDLKPSTIHDINAMVALYRPGPLESIPQYIERKHDNSKIKYLDPRLKDILDRSFGVITYQDDVMMIAIKLAGYSWLEADKLRKAMGKKIPKDMQEQKEKLLKGFVKNGLTEKKANELWTLIEPFAAYGFNKCLSGDTEIYDSISKRKLTIKEAYDNNYRPNIPSLNNSKKIEYKKVRMIMENGIKDVFELKTRSGRKIKATDNHPFLTLDGWKNLEELKKGIRVATVKDLSNSSVSNRKTNNTESDIYWDEIISIEEKGKEMTYDINLPPYHNFIANNIIVHNSHAASYGRVAYQTSYMKANFPAIYMSAVLTADSGDVEKIGEIITECKRMNIPILPPDINESYSQFTVIKGETSPDGIKGPDRIRFGLVTIKNFGQGASTAIIEERKKGGKFKSLADFLKRVQDKNMNKKSIEALIKAGALDSFGERGNLLYNIENILSFNKEHSKNSNKNQDSLFSSLISSDNDGLELKESDPISSEKKLAWEKELLGLYVSGHPLDKYKEVLDKREMNIKKAKETLKDGKETVVAGIIEDVRPLNTKKGDMMAFVKLTDFTGSIEVVCFPRTYMEYRAILVTDKCIALKGKMSERNGTMTMIADKIKLL